MVNNFPKLHNATWPGVVGKGAAGEPPIDLDTMLDLTAAAEVDGARFDGVDLFLFDPHVSIDPRTTTSKRWPTRSGRADLVVGRVVAPVWPPTGGGVGDGRLKRTKPVSHAGPQGLPHRARSCANSASARTASCASIRPAAPGRLGPRPPGQQQRIAETFRRGVRHRRGLRRAARGRGGNLLGRHAQLGRGWWSCWRWSTGRRRSASRPTWPTRCCTCWATTRRRTHSAGELRLERPAASDDGLREPDRPLRPWTIDFHVAQNDATVNGLGLARQDRPPLPAERSQRQARHRQVTPATGCATRTATSPKRSATSAGTAACSPTPR